MPLAWRHLPIVDAQWIFISTHLFAHHARFKGSARGAPKIAYVHTPARYIWSPELDDRGASARARAIAGPLKPLDRRRAQELTTIAANSRYVADRIAKYWERDAVVIHPPVPARNLSAALSADDEKVLDSLPDQFILGASRMVSYKHLDRAIFAGAVAKTPVVIAGSGPEELQLREYARAHHPGEVTFVLEPTSELLSRLYARASALVFAPVEDFGIMPVEAMSCGTPVVANRQGGTAESVLDGTTGALVTDWNDPQEVLDAVNRALRCRADDCRDRASVFGPEEFESKIRNLIDSAVQA